MKQLRIAKNFFTRKKLVGKDVIARRTQMAKRKTAATRKSTSFMKKKLLAIEDEIKSQRKKRA